MDVKRGLLSLVLFLLAMQLWSAWQKEHPSFNQPNTQSFTTPPSSENFAYPLQAQKEPANKLENPKRRYIQVQTDVLRVTIDSLGGDIIKAELLQYPQQLGQTGQPTVLLNDQPEHLYLVKSGLLAKNSQPAIISYTAEQDVYELKPGQKEIQLKLQGQTEDGIKITKVYRFYPDNYAIKVTYNLENQGNHTWLGQVYALIKRNNEASNDQGLFHSNTYLGAAISSPEHPYEKISFKDMAKEPLDRIIQGGWIAMLQHYFLTAWIPEQQTSYRYYSEAATDNSYSIGILSPKIEIPAKTSFTTQAKLYIGPESTDRLKDLAPHLNLTVDYGWLWFISIALFKLMKFIYGIIGNWGWSIVLVTVCIKVLFYRLSAASLKSMADMRKLQPRLAALKERYGEDRQKLSQATMELYKKEKINPLGGCLPILVQIPVFLALYWVLIESVELRQAPFILWIKDLSVKDPYYVLPLLMGGLMYIQQRLNPAPPDPVQARVMLLLPLIFTVFFLNFPAGLVLYWVINSALSILQQWYITYRLEHLDLSSISKTKK